jgi:hypothetical protein
VKKIWKWPIRLLFGIILLYILIPHYDCTYYYSRDKKNVITKVVYNHIITLQSGIYITPEYYSKYALPTKYISPILKLRDSQYEILIKWVDGKCYFYICDYKYHYNSINLDREKEIIEIDRQDFFKMKNEDSTLVFLDGNNFNP